MKNKLRRLSLVTQITLGIVATPAIAGNLYAQEPIPESASKSTPSTQDAQTLQSVIVTGSHIRRVDIETASPVITVDRQQIHAADKATIGSLITDLPAVTGGMNTPNIGYTGGQGKTQVGLRGLGAERTLILIDGERTATDDLNAIPSSAVDRIEVLTTGASSVYGSDAIGGVINVILRKDVQGAEASAGYGISNHQDGTRKTASFMFGQASDRGNFFGGIEYNKFSPIFDKDRAFSAHSNDLLVGSDGNIVRQRGGSINAERGYLAVPKDVSRRFGCSTGGPLSLNVSSWVATDSPTGEGDYHCFNGVDDKYDYMTAMLLQTPQERTSGFFKGTYHLNNNIDVYLTAIHNKTQSSSTNAPNVYSSGSYNGTFISKDSYYNPFGVDFSRIDGSQYNSRLYPAGLRSSLYNNSSDSIYAGLRGAFSTFQKDWTWTAGARYGHTSTVASYLGLTSMPTIVPGQQASFLNEDNVVQCGYPDSPISLSACTPYDPFNLNSNSARTFLASAKVSSPSMINSWTLERALHAEASGGLIDLPAGTVQLAAGVSHRLDRTNNTVGPLLLVDPVDGTCPLGSSNCSAHLVGQIKVSEAYVELFIPLLDNLPLANSLNVTLGDRYSKYDLFGSTNNGKIGLEYRPIDSLLLRGTVASVFRAPTTSDVFGAPVRNAPYIQRDPCEHIVSFNPACVNVPLDGTFVNSNIATAGQIQTLQEGAVAANMPIKPESGKSFDFGLVYSPGFLPGFSLTADVWRIALSGTIGTVGAQAVLDLCSTGTERYCALISRTPSGTNQGQLINIVEPTTNLGAISVSGIDLSSQYALPDLKMGQFILRLSGTYLKKFDIQTAPGSAGNQDLKAAGKMAGTGTSIESACPFAAGQLCFLPRARATGSVGWHLNNWDARWALRYISAFRMADAPAGRHIQGLDQYGATFYNDVSLGYNVKSLSARFDFGVSNLFDKQPPIMGDNRMLNANTDPIDFDVVGRFYSAKMTITF